MLHLVEQNKAGRNLSNDEVDKVNWRGLFKASEDSFTSSIFGLLTYLPSNEFWEILKLSTIDYPNLLEPGPYLGIEFWPKWKHDGRRYCEPDVFIRFANFDLIIEAKRFDYNQQNINQWEAELRSYFEEYREEDRTVYFIAVGGLYESNQVNSFIEIENKQIIVLKCRWRSILHVINQELYKAQGINMDLNSSAKANILRDIILAFRIHGFQTGLLFDTMPTNISIDSKIHYHLQFLKSFHLNNISDLKIDNFLQLIKIL